MALQSSGAISLNDIRLEFGGSEPHSLSEYYGAASGIPGSGSISFSNFYGKSDVPTPTAGTEYELYYKSYLQGTSSASDFVIADKTYVLSVPGTLTFRLRVTGGVRYDSRNTYPVTSAGYWYKNGSEILTVSASAGESSIVSINSSASNGDVFSFRYSKEFTSTTDMPVEGWINTGTDMSGYDVI